jgi:hypothetical protein
MLRAQSLGQNDNPLKVIPFAKSIAMNYLSSLGDSMARKLQIEWQEDVETLNAAYRNAKDGQDRQRLHALWLLRQGRSMAEIAEIIDVHYRTVQEWVAWYRQGSIAAIFSAENGVTAVTYTLAYTLSDDAAGQAMGKLIAEGANQISIEQSLANLKVLVESN